MIIVVKKYQKLKCIIFLYDPIFDTCYACLLIYYLQECANQYGQEKYLKIHLAGTGI